jgi:transcriptional regulator with XRE-family HTH domain
MVGVETRCSASNQFHAFFMHIGQHIKEVMRQQGTTATQLAKDICCTRPHIHRIFRKENIDIALLERISTALKYDFFHDLSEEFKKKV